jgi:hypothetical protein
MMSLKKFSVLALSLAASSAFAVPMPVHSFGPLAAANFGGSGIPNDAVAITTFGGVTLGLSATQRFGTPTVTNNGAGIYQAVGGAFGPGDNLAKWNFNFFIGDATRSTFTYKLFGDYRAAVGDLEASYTDISAYLVLSDSRLTGGTIQNSENLGFGTDFSQFNPNVAGQYGFYLAAYDGQSAEVARTSVLVNVSQVPEPGSLALVGLALAGLATLRRKA